MRYPPAAAAGSRVLQSCSPIPTMIFGSLTNAHATPPPSFPCQVDVRGLKETLWAGIHRVLPPGQPPEGATLSFQASHS